jgi:uncharacterized protein
MDRHGMLEHIMNHSLAVRKVALFLSRELNRRGQTLDLGLVEAASLLHDLAKTECLKTKEDHAEAGFQLLVRLGHRRIGEVVAQHIVVWKLGDPSRVTEEEVVNYADKRVRHDRIVSLRDRFVDLRHRYGKEGDEDLEAWEGLERMTFEIERKIFSILGMDPADLQHLQDSDKEGQISTRRR